MKYRLGIDLGSSSLGWCCLQIQEDRVINILDIGVRIYPDGRNDQNKDPLCVARREFRGSRTRLRRFKLRQKQLIADLQDGGLLPKKLSEFKALEHLNPYELRAKAIHEKISLFELGRAIFHLNQRRGFLSNRHEKRNKDNTKTAKAMDHLQKLIEENGCATLGELMYNNPSLRRFKKDANVISEYPNRQMYADEFDKIWEVQQSYYCNILTTTLKERIKQDIFFQRPLKRQETGFCWLEPEEKRCPKAYVIAQQFRIMSDIANLRISYPYDRALNKSEREDLFDLLNNPPADSYDTDYYVSWDKILHILRLDDGDVTLNLMRVYKKGLLCNITNAILGNAQAIGKIWYELPTEVKDKIVYDLQDYSLQQGEAKSKLLQVCTKLTNAQADYTMDQSLLLPDGYSNLSAKAMSNLLNDMKVYETDYAEAVERIYHKTAAEGGYFEELDELPPYQELFTESLIGGHKDKYDKKLDYDNYMGRITNVSVHIALNQLRAVINELVARYGKPVGITIELGRELTKGRKALFEIDKKQRENEKINAEARAEIRKAGCSVTPFNIEKYKIWRNLNPKDAKERIDIYTGKAISISDLFSEKYEIEHVLPYSWTYDDSYNNKIITRANINRQKSNQLPYQFFSDESQLRSVAQNDEMFAEMSLAEVIKRAKDVDKARGNLKKIFNFNALAWRFSKNARDIFNKNNENMARDLTDMQYMSKLAKKYLTCICPPQKIVSAKGQMTDLLKSVWKINDTLPEDYRLWKPQKWQEKQ